MRRFWKAYVISCLSEEREVRVIYLHCNTASNGLHCPPSKKRRIDSLEGHLFRLFFHFAEASDSSWFFLLWMSCMKNYDMAPRPYDEWISLWLIWRIFSSVVSSQSSYSQSTPAVFAVWWKHVPKKIPSSILLRLLLFGRMNQQSQ